MKILCAPDPFVGSTDGYNHRIVLYSISDTNHYAGNSIIQELRRQGLKYHATAWDLLSIALSVVAADRLISRDDSTDGWTREIQLTIAVTDPTIWAGQKHLFEKQLRFLSTDIWHLEFIEGGHEVVPPRRSRERILEEDCVALFSGGLDSFIGALDLVESGVSPCFVSQLVQGEGEHQRSFAQLIKNGATHVQLNHNTQIQNGISGPSSQRTRSFIFLAYGILVGTCTKAYHEGQTVNLYMSENGFISINPPLTGARLGSLSTRTTNPIYISMVQSLLSNVGIRVSIKNEYQLVTKGDMLLNSARQDVLKQYAYQTVSCGKYRVHNSTHCGRCVPCLIRRAAFKKWGEPDQTEYKFDDLSSDDRNHARYMDVQSVGIAVAKMEADGLDAFIGMSLDSTVLDDTAPFKNVVSEGLSEIKVLLHEYGLA